MRVEMSRLEAFSDGVIAIIITIMVLALKAPHGDTRDALARPWPVFLSCVLSFPFVGTYWNDHRRMPQAGRSVTGGTLWANLHLPFWLSLLPFTAGWMGENSIARLPTMLYGANLLIRAIAYDVCRSARPATTARAMPSRRPGASGSSGPPRPADTPPMRLWDNAATQRSPPPEAVASSGRHRLWRCRSVRAATALRRRPATCVVTKGKGAPVSSTTQPVAFRAAVFACCLIAGALGGTPAGAQDLSAEVAEAMRLRPDRGRGKQGFEVCVSCHRSTAGGRTDGAIPRLSGQHASVIVKQVSDIRTGRRLNPEMMPYVEGKLITPQLLADIADYLQSLPLSGSIGKGPGTALERGKTLFARDCSPCHGQGGEGLAAGFFPMLASQHYGYLLRELEMIRDGRRGNSNPGMVQVIKAYSVADLQAVADHASRLPPPAR